MGITDAPEWLMSAFTRSLKNIGASAPKEVLDEAGKALAEKWTSKTRFFHNIKHLTDVLAAIDALAESSRNPDLVRVAAWYHGVVFRSEVAEIYNGRGGEDAQASAEYCRTALAELGVPEETVTQVCELILALERHCPDKANVDASVLSDADLRILAAEPQRFKDYRSAVRKEYAHVPIGDYLAARINIVDRFLARKAIFTSPLASGWEAQARENLQAESDRLKQEYEKLAVTGEIRIVPAQVDPELAASFAEDKADAQIPPTPVEGVPVVAPSEAQEEAEPRSPYETANQADMASSMEACETLLDEMTQKIEKVSTAEIKMMSQPEAEKPKEAPAEKEEK